MNERTFSHLQAHKLDLPERRLWLPIAEVLAAINLHEGDVIADIGAGTGYFALPMAEAVGPTGEVWAIDVQPEMLAILASKLRDSVVKNVECVQGEATTTGLAPSSFNLVLMANLWHELDQIPKVLAEVRRILRPRGRVAVLDWRPLVDQPPGPPLEQRISSMSVVEDLAIAGFQKASNTIIGTYSYLVIAER